MKRFILLLLSMLVLVESSASALDWAYGFVIWDGKMYEVKTDQPVTSESIGERIGEVKVEADDMTGNYYGDASNSFEKGTGYYEIIGTPSDEAIAVEEENGWVTAVYLKEAPFRVRDLLYSPWLWIALVGIFVGVSLVIVRGLKAGGH